MTRYLLAHDLGTSGNKATLFSEDGRLVSSATATYETHFFNQNWAEQNPEDWWTAVCDSTRHMLSQSGVDPASIAVVSFSGHMMGCLCLDRNGQPLRPHILWADQRAEKQAKQLDEALTPQRFYRLTGHRSSASYGLQKLMWVRDNEPDIYERTEKVVNAKDWIVYRMTGQLMTEYSDATSMTALDLEQRVWSEEILAAARIDPDKLPEIVPSTHVAGGVTDSAAAATGLAPGTPVVMGGGDGLCATVGAGCVRENVVHACIGSSAWISYASRKPVFDEQMRTFNWIHIVPDMVCPCGTMQAAGQAYAWMKQTMARHEAELAASRRISPYQLIDEQAAQAPPGSNGLIFLPYLIGERAPRWDPQAKGAFIGLNMSTTRADMFRSVLEGVTFNLAIIADIYREHGVDISRINLIGGGARGDVWCQIMADVWSAEINRLNYLDEATSMGAAVTGGVGVGLYEDFTAIDRYISVANSFRPDPARTAAYQPARHNFEACYQALRPVFPQLR